MTREQRIIEQADKYSEIFYKVNDNYGDCFRGGFIDGAKWADKTIIYKACEWLNKNITNYQSDMMGYIEYSQISDIIRDFRKAMEE